MGLDEGKPDFNDKFKTMASSVFQFLSMKKSLQALSKYGRMDAVELEKEIDYEIS
ncbi:hypothetical protein QM910_03830 [Streptococcus oralis]|uniref:hypothetical protein n=1 Tax=Streptococcus oralis TaxID=1303 RepID=UPI00163B146B